MNVLSTDERVQIEFPSDFGSYKYVRPVGQGSSSVVILVEHRLTQDLFAAKLLKRTSTIDKNMEREIRFAQSISHPNIISVKDILYLTDIIIVIMEFCPRGDLITEISRVGGFSPSVIRTYSYQVLAGIAFLHSVNWTHRDLKPDNILVDMNGHIKITDFGHCGEVKKNDLMMRTLCGTYYYTPPEVMNEQPYDGKKADIWSLGVVLFCLATGQLPWEQGSDAAVRERILNGVIIDIPTIDTNALRLIKRCIVVDPSDRASAEELLNDPWFIPEKKVEQVGKLKVRNWERSKPSLVNSQSRIGFQKRTELRKHATSLYNFTFA